MKTTYYEMTGDYSIAVVDIWPFLPPEDSDQEAYWIARIKVPSEHRREGIGTRLMEEVCQDADDEGVELVLTVNAYDNGMDNETLTAWYEGFGFSEHDSTSGLRRLPCVP